MNAEMIPAETMPDASDVMAALRAVVDDLNKGGVLRADGEAAVFVGPNGVCITNYDISFPLNRDPDSPDPLRRMPDYLLVLEIARAAMKAIPVDVGIPDSTPDSIFAPITEAASRGIKL